MKRLDGYLLATVLIGTFLVDWGPPAAYLGYAVLAGGVVLAVYALAEYSSQYRFWGMLVLTVASVALGWTGRYGFSVVCFLTGFVPWLYHVLKRRRRQDGEPKDPVEHTGE